MSPEMIPFLYKICLLFARRLFASPPERDCFWLALKAPNPSFPLWSYAVAFFVSVQRPLRDVTLNKAFFLTQQ